MKIEITAWRDISATHFWYTGKEQELYESDFCMIQRKYDKIFLNAKKRKGERISYEVY